MLSKVRHILKMKAISNYHNEQIVDMYFHEEDRHFRENLEEEDYKDKEVFVAKLKKHILYSIIHLKVNYDETLVSEWIEEYWNENKEDDEDDEEDAENFCDCCVKGWIKPNEFGLCECWHSKCGRPLSICKYSCYEDEENKKSKLGAFSGDIYGCVGGDCKYCFRCNPIYYFGVRRCPPLPNKVQQELKDIIKYNDKRCNAYINAYNMKLIDDNYNLCFNNLCCNKCRNPDQEIPLYFINENWICIDCRRK
jgi:hypothetical protein